jgi:hypothetical protein
MIPRKQQFARYDHGDGGQGPWQWIEDQARAAQKLLAQPDAMLTRRAPNGGTGADGPAA